ncbi:MAG: hypothetical protein ACYC8V_00950 [Caulobacteraceae bacterium]
MTQAPHWLVAADMGAGAVRRILRDPGPAGMPISAVRPASRRQPSKVAVFVDFLNRAARRNGRLIYSRMGSILSNLIV